jgi:hypothetical protein
MTKLPAAMPRLMGRAALQAEAPLARMGIKYVPQKRPAMAAHTNPVGLFEAEEAPSSPVRRADRMIRTPPTKSTVAADMSHAVFGEAPASSRNKNTPHPSPTRRFTGTHIPTLRAKPIRSVAAKANTPAADQRTPPTNTGQKNEAGKLAPVQKKTTAAAARVPRVA